MAATSSTLRCRQAGANPQDADTVCDFLRCSESADTVGTGTVDMIQRCVDAGLREPEFDVGARFVTRIWRAPKTKREPVASEAWETRGKVDAAPSSR